MKKLFSILMIMAALLFAGQAMAQGIGLEWDANPPADEVIGYIVYFTDDDPGGDSMAITKYHKDVGNVTTVFFDIFVPKDGKHYWYCVSAYNAFKESVGRSNIVDDTRPTEYTPPDDVLPAGALDPGNVSGLIKT